MASYCGSTPHGDNYPQFVSLKKGSLAWANTHQENHVFVLKKGLLLSSVYTDADEIPFNLFQPLCCIGLSEIFTPQSIETYYLKALAHSQVCYFSTDALRRLMVKDDPKTALANCSSAMNSIYHTTLTLTVVNAQRLLKDKLMVLLHIVARGMIASEGTNTPVMQLTQQDLAQIINTDRTSIAKALKVLRDEGQVEAVGRGIRIGPTPDPRPLAVVDYISDTNNARKASDA